MKTYIRFIFVAIFSAFAIQTANAHCQIPCGIYGDDDRFTAMFEDVKTIAKATLKINELAEAEPKNHNQIVRWVLAKEDHADKISETVLVYFLQQRIKAGQEHYTEKLVALHKIVVLAMKTKQNTDATIVDDLKTSIEEFQALYVHKH